MKIKETGFEWFSRMPQSDFIDKVLNELIEWDYDSNCGGYIP